MKKQTIFSSILPTLAVVGFFASQCSAQITWDADTGTTGAQDGAGTWNTSNNNWWDGAANVSFTNGSNVTIGAGSGAGAAGTITVDVGGVTTGSLTFNNAGSSSYTITGGSITGGALTKNGNSGLQFDSANTFSSITVNGGPDSASDAALRLGNASALGTAPITFNNTATMTGFFFLPGFGSNTTLSNNIAFSTTGITTKILSTGVAGSTTSLPGTFNTTTLSGLLTGGSSTSIIFNNNNVIGGVAKLRLTNASNTVTLQRWTLNRGALEFTSNGALGNANNGLYLDVGSSNVGTGLHFGANNITLGSGRSITAQTTTIIDTQTFTGSQINGTISGGALLIKRGTADLRINAASARTGDWRIAQGSLTLGNATAAGTGTITIESGATLSTVPLNTTTITNAINLGTTGTGTRTLLMNGSSTSNIATYSGVISGGVAGGTLFINNSTGGSFEPETHLTNTANTFIGLIEINRGGLGIAANGSLGNSANTVRFNSNPGADLTFLNAMTYNRNTALDTDTDFDTGNNTVTASGVISGAGTTGNGVSTLTKRGGGTLILTGSNTYTAGTTVAAGTLLVNNTAGSGTGAGDVFVDAGATLGGTGSLTGNVAVAGTLGAGTLSTIENLSTGGVTLNSGSTFDYDLDSSALDGDMLNVTGGLTLNSGVTLNLQELTAGTVALGAKLTLISYSGSWNGTAFSLFADDSTFTLGANQWLINYNDTSGGANLLGGGSGASFVTITAVPEPGALTLAGLCVAAVGSVRRRRQS